MEIRRTIPADTARLDAVTAALAEAEYVPLMTPASLIEGSDALSLLIDDELIAIGGIVSPSPGLGVAWLFCRAPLPQHRRVVLYRLRQGWQQLLAHQPYRRIETLVLANFALANRLAQWLGFRYCCPKPLLGPGGEDFVEYVCYPGLS